MQTFADGYRAYVGNVNRHANPCPVFSASRESCDEQDARRIVTTAFSRL
jgi:hypothetical protein